MICSRKKYCKDGQTVYTNSDFIYCSSVYKLWKEGASLVEEKYYLSPKPITLKKKDIMKKFGDYSIFRYFTLEYAPEEWLIRNNFKIIEND